MLQDQGTTVYLVSGGFRCIIEYFADYLAIPRTNIYANRILFSEEGSTQLILSVIGKREGGGGEGGREGGGERIYTNNILSGSLDLVIHCPFTR